MGFMKNITNNNGGLRLYISASNNTKVKVTIPLQGYADSITIPKDSVKVVVIPSSLGYLAEFDSVLNKAIHITSDFPVSIAAMNLANATTDASIILPVANIPKGTTYVTGHPNGGARNHEVLLVACEDSTRVSIIPAAVTSRGRPAGVPYTISLNKGQLYQVGSTALEFSGTVVKVLSQTKLAVFSGHECSNWPCGACDHQYEQVMPLDVLDTSYCVPPNFGHVNGYYLKIVPLDTLSTTIQANGVTYNNVSSRRPLVLNVTADSGYYVRSTKLFHCYQFLKGAGCNGYITNGYGDPAQLELVSTKYFGESSIFTTVNSTNLRDHFVSIVIKTPAKNNVYLDKTKIDSGEFRVFPYNRNYSYAGLNLSLGQHVVECADGLLAYCYGVGSYESYLYLAGFSLPNFDLDFRDSVVEYDCRNQKIRMQFTAKSEKILKKYTWHFGDSTIGTGNPVQHLYNKTGTYTVKLVGEDFAGKKDSVTKLVKVNWPSFDPVRNKIICGLDTVTFEEKNPFFTNFKWQDSSSGSSLKVWNTQNIWVKATDTTGYCKFVDSGVVGKIDIFSNITVDSIETCWRFNRFKFKDQTSIVSDQIYHKAWVFPWKTDWDVSETEVHFPMPGRYKVYFDVYTTQVNCKARYPIEVMVYPNPKAYSKVKGEEFCSNKLIHFRDSSQITSGYIKQVKWNFDDSTTITSDSLNTYKSFKYDKTSGMVIRFYDQIPISDGNCTDTVRSAVNVWPKPDVNFTLAPGDTIRCLPAARWTFTSTTKVDQDSFKLFWDAGNGQKSTANSMRNIRYTSAGKYQVKLKATSPFGCHDSISKTIEVINVPNASFTSPDTAQCFNDHIFAFDNTSTGQYLKYLWIFDNGDTSSQKDADSVYYTSPGYKTVKLKVYSDIAGCEDSTSRQVLVMNPPKAGMLANNDTQCLAGNSFSIQNTSVFSQPYKSGQWVISNNVDTNFHINTFSLNDTGTYRISLVVYDQENCFDTGFSILRVLPQPNVSIGVNDSVQCFTTNRFVFRTGKQADEWAYWKIDGQQVLSGKSDSLVYTGNIPGMHQARLVISSAAGCKDSIQKGFRLLDPVRAGFTTNNDTQCLVSNQFEFSDISTAPNDVINSWVYTTDNTTYSGQANSGIITYAQPGSRTVRLEIKTLEGCLDSISKTVVVLPHPDGFITGDSVCLYQPAFIRFTQTSGNPVVTWSWDLGDGNAATGQTVNHTYNNVNTYDLQVTVSDKDNCIRTVALQDGVTVYPLPDPSFTYTESTAGINKSKIVFIPQLASGYSYHWKFPDGSTQTADTPALEVNDLLKGIVTLRVKNAYGCLDSTFRDIYIFPNNFNVYAPNSITPNDDRLNDVFRLEGLGGVSDFRIQIVNRWGEEVFLSNDPASGWDGTYQGEIVSEGVYMYYASFRYFDGKSYVFRGTITVLR